MIRFRLVELDTDGYIKKEFYNSPSFSGDEHSRKFKDAIDECLCEYGYKLKFLKKELRPQHGDIISMLSKNTRGEQYAHLKE